MDEKLFLLVMRVFGNKLYEMQTGFTVMFNLLVEQGLFAVPNFQLEMAKVERLPEIRRLREVLDLLNKPMDSQALERLLKEYEGPVQ